MKFTFSWLLDHLESEASIDDISHTLSMIGLEVESIEDRAKDIASFVVGHVTDARQHPNADRLQLCIVDVGGGESHEVVCGAPNARAGMKGVFARQGTWIPGTGITLKKSKIRGVVSAGMLCSEAELGLSDEHDGIIELADDAETGSPAAEVLGLSDPVIEIGLTPNRPDCAGVRGIARDLAAAGLGSLKPLDVSPVEGVFESPVQWRRDLAGEAADACPMVVGRTFRGITNGASPQWMQDRLKAIGLRPISALVDITNYVTFDLARPLHVFDVDALAGDLTMRLARAGEIIGALDGKDYVLDSTMSVIADDGGVQGIGGVMGGSGSGCGDDTTTAFLEVALFDPIRTAATGRKLAIASDARYRFERGVDPTSALWGAEVAARLITGICGGEASTLSIAGEMPDWVRHQSLRKSRIASLGGIQLAPDEPSRLLADLGFENDDDGEIIHASIPPWRPDVDGEADLVEEVLRIHGYDNIPVVSMERETSIAHPALDAAQRRGARVRRALAGRGLIEAVTFSFMPRARAAAFGGVGDELVLVNPISTDLDAMRPSILPNLLDAVTRNQARGIGDVALFELGPQYSDDTPAGQSLTAAGVRVGADGSRHWSSSPRPVDAYDTKADAMAALTVAAAPVANLQVAREAPGWYHPGRSGTLMLGHKPLAYFGEIHPTIIRDFELRGAVSAFEVIMDAVPPTRAKKSAARPFLALAVLQPVERDFAFVVEGNMDAARLVRAAASADKNLITGVDLFDVYQGAELGDGKKSLAITVTLQPTDATLTDAEIDIAAEKVVAAVTKATGGVLRG